MYGIFQPFLASLVVLVMVCAASVLRCRLYVLDRDADAASLTSADYGVHVRGVRSSITEQDMREFFGQWGDVVHVSIARRIRRMAPKGHKMVAVERELGRLRAMLAVKGPDTKVGTRRRSRPGLT